MHFCHLDLLDNLISNNQQLLVSKSVYIIISVLNLLQLQTHVRNGWLHRFLF